MISLRTAIVTLAATVPALAQQPAGSPPDLHAVPLPILETAREHPEALWSFLVDPSTPYLQARAAALRCREVFPLELVRKLQRARWDLMREQQLHGFGMEDAPFCAISVLRRPLPKGERQRRILGRNWTAPEPRTPYPESWTEEARAPWPWRVQQVLERTWWTIVPRGEPGERTEAWLAECMTWPIDDDADARIFVEATAAASHTKTLAVLARWRRIMLDARLPQAAALAAQQLGETHRLLVWGDPEARLACQVIAADVLRHSPHPAARSQCAYGLSSLRSCFVVEKGHATEVRGPLPIEALLAAAERAVEPHAASAHWELLYVYAFSVCEAVDAPPLLPARSMRPDSPEVPKLLEQFARWLEEQRPELEKQVATRAEAVARVRARLIELGG